MPVEHLAIVEGPLAGLGDDGASEGELLLAVKKLLVENDVRPWWLIIGSGIGLFVAESRLKGAALGAVLGSGMSMLCSSTCRAEAPWLTGVEVEKVGLGQIHKSGIQSLGQIHKSGIQSLGSVEMPPENVIGLVAAGLLGTYLIFGRG